MIRLFNTSFSFGHHRQRCLVRSCVLMVIVLTQLGGVGNSVVFFGGVARGQGIESASGERVTIAINTFGVGGAARTGSWVGMNVGLRSNEAVSRAVLVVWEMGDPDGDIAEISSKVVLNAGMNVSVWLYGRLSFRDSMNSQWTINVYPLDEDGERVNEVIGSHRFRAGQLADATVSLIGVLGLRPAGLGPYGTNISNGAYPVASGERTEIKTGISLNGLPTRWMGLQQFEALVWIDPDPAMLRIEQADALMEWVRRGGRLVIVLPELTQKWGMTLLTPILPEVEIITLENQEIRNAGSAGGVLRYLKRPEPLPNDLQGRSDWWIVPQRRDPPYPTVTLHALRANAEGGWGDTDSWPLMPLEPGFAAEVLERYTGNPQPAETLTFAAERRVGFGMVTFVGIPVAHPLLNRSGLELPQAEVFWNRVLGRRCDTPSAAELNRVLLKKEFNESRASRQVGKVLPSSIVLKSEGGAGFLLALVLFIFYWVISGPLAYGVLKNKGLQSQSWLAFALAGVVFSVVGWGGAKMLRARGILPRHLTILDHVYGEEWERSRTYLTTSLEGYGTQTVAAELVDPNGPDEFYDAVYPLTDPDKGITPFPDPRRYEVDSNDQRAVSYPARATAKQLVIESMHEPMSGFGTPIFANDSLKPKIIKADSQTQSTGGRLGESGQGLPALAGTLTHALPGALYDVNILFVSDQEWVGRFGRRPDGKAESPARLKTFSWSLNRWLPGEELQLGSLQIGKDSYFWNHSKAAKTDVQEITRHYRTSYGTQAAANYSTKNLRMDLRALSFFRYLDQPQWAGKTSATPAMMVRRFGRDLDLSNWLNRPCLIIMGYLEQPEEPQPVPTPISIDGALMERTATNSHVFVRWIYPFPAGK